MKFGRRDVERYRRDGFLLVTDVLSARETQLMKVELEHLLASGAVTMKSGVCLGITLVSAVFRQVNQDSRLLDILESIIGSDIEFWSDRAVFKGKDAVFPTPWHQDWPYWKGTHKTSLWIAIDEARPEDGCLRFVPGSHHLGALEHGEPKAVTGEGFAIGSI